MGFLTGIYLKETVSILNLNSQLPQKKKKGFICFNESPLEIMKNISLLYLKSSFLFSR